MNGASFSEAPYHRFKEFIAPGADRFTLLGLLLEELALDFSVITIAGNRHFFVSLNREAPGEETRLGQDYTILVAHYDRTPGSPGANDNSAAVFQLLKTAMKLKEKKARRWFIVFTDKEELKEGEGIRNQGSYALALGLRNTGLGGARIYSFDACGTGDTLVISTTVDHLIKNDEGPGISRAKHLIQRLRNRALEAARDLRMDRVILLPTPFSDDAGFLRAGLAVQTVTVLPSQEAGLLVSTLRKDPDFAAALINRDVQITHNQRLIPETWRYLNGPGDSALRLTPQHYPRVVRFAAALCEN
jgi:hypothetical protein